MGINGAVTWQDLTGSGGHHGLSETLTATGENAVAVEDGAWLLRAQFQRHGSDLMAQGEAGQRLLIADYFSAQQAPDIDLGEGVLKGHVVARLAGPLAPGQSAQLGADDASAIGEIASASGDAWVTHADGSRMALVTGSAIFDGDVVETGASGALAIAFVDGTSLSLSEDARMVIDELVYSPGAADNVASLSMVQGLFVLVSGDVAKTGEMVVETPVSTIGIRGTSVAIQAATEGLRNLITLLQDPDGNVGVVEVATAVASVILSAIGETTSVSSANEAPTAIEVLTATDVETLYRAALATMQTMQRSGLGVTSGADGDNPGGSDGPDGGPTDDPAQDGAEPEPAASDADIEAFSVAVGDLFAALADALAEEEAEEDDVPVNLVADGEPDGTLPLVLPPVLPVKTRVDPPAVVEPPVTGNQNPKAVDDTATFTVGSEGITIPVLANDSDPDGDALTIVALDTSGLLGFASIVDNQIFYEADYDSNGGFFFLDDGETAIETFTYTVSDGKGGNATASVTITVEDELPPVLEDPPPNPEIPISGDVATETADNGDAFLQGSFIELGISANGTLGTSSAMPESFEAGNHTPYNGLSFFFNLDGVGDDSPQSGDAFLPGVPVETFSIGFTDDTGSFLSSNHNAGDFTGIPLSFDEITSGAEGTSVVSTGGIAGRLGLTQSITLNGEDSYYTTSVTLTNLTDSAMSDVRYMRNNDPDQDLDFGGAVVTLNDVLSNPGAEGSIAAVNAKGANGGQSILMLADQAGVNSANGLAQDTIEVRTSAFGFENTNPFAASAFDNPADPNGALQDIGINIVFAIDSLAAGQSVTFSWITSANGGTNGGDVMMALVGQTMLNGHGGDDQIFASQAAVEETLIGGNGEDTLVALGTTGGIGDVLLGGDGDDTLIGGTGQDILSGGLGADAYVFSHADALFSVESNTSYDGVSGTPDMVTDFVSGTDSLRLLQSAFSGMALGNLANGISYSIIEESYDGTNAGVNLKHDLGQASFVYSQSDHTLFFDSNGNGAGYQAVADIDQMAAGDIEVVASV